jgi:hypothetical protein
MSMIVPAMKMRRIPSPMPRPIAAGVLMLEFNDELVPLGAVVICSHPADIVVELKVGIEVELDVCVRTDGVVEFTSSKA